MAGENFSIGACPSLTEIGSKTAEKNSAQTHKQTDRQTNSKQTLRK